MNLKITIMDIWFRIRGCLKYFSLHLYDEGFVLQMPTMEKPEEVPEFIPSPKLFHVLKESSGMGRLSGYRHSGGSLMI